MKLVETNEISDVGRDRTGESIEPERERLQPSQVPDSDWKHAGETSAGKPELGNSDGIAGDAEHEQGEGSEMFHRRVRPSRELLRLIRVALSDSRSDSPIGRRIKQKMSKIVADNGRSSIVDDRKDFGSSGFSVSSACFGYLLWFSGVCLEGEKVKENGREMGTVPVWGIGW